MVTNKFDVTNVTPTSGLTFGQWIVKEAIRAQNEADQLWESMDALQPQEDFEDILKRYNRVCDWMDELEYGPMALYQWLDATGK